MGDSAPTGEAAAAPAFTRLLAEAAAGAPGAEARLVAHLRPMLEAMWQQRGTSECVLADAGALVRAQVLEAAEAPPEAEVPAAQDGTKAAKGGRKGPRGNARKGTRKGARAAKADSGSAESAASAGLLTAPGADQAAQAMERLVREQVASLEPEGPAMHTLRALQSLQSLDPALARIARWRWFSGLDAAAIAPLMDESESEVERRWLKARAFLAVATRPGPATATT